MTNTQNDYTIAHRISISGFFKEIDNLTNDVGSDDYIGDLKDITKRHWKPIDSRQNCANRECRKAFSPILERPHHCRRCGEIFCFVCLKYQRRLNKLAHFDPDGQLYKVCKTCFEKDQITDGQVCNHTRDFLTFRSRLKADAENKLTSIFKSEQSFEKECERLISGFASSIGKSEIRRTVYEMRSMVSTPDWMKSSIWLQANTASSCFVCKGSFGIMKPKKFCRICGLSICKPCSSSDLLIYFPDNEQQEAKGLPRLAIIKIIGCPDVEPEISLYLRVCPKCKEKMIESQVLAVEEEAEAVDSETSFVDLLHRLDIKFQKSEDGVKKHLPNYSDVVESLEDGSRVTTNKSNTKLLAKTQGDLADVLAQHVTHVQQLKKLVPKSETQARLMKNYIRAKCEFYMDNMCLYRNLKEKLTRAMPVESLNFIQRIMDKNAIISTQLYLRQLVYELLHLTDKYHMDDDLPVFLMCVEQEVEGEVKKCLILNKEDVDEHLELVKDMIRSRIKEHKLIRPSQRRITQHGSKYVFEFMLLRTDDILSQVINQLQLISANRSFPAGKKALEMGLDGVKRKKTEQQEEGKEFVLV